MNTKKHWVWQAPAETLETIAAVLRRHWAAAKKQQPSLFSQPEDASAGQPIDAYHLTIGGKLIK